MCVGSCVISTSIWLIFETLFVVSCLSCHYVYLYMFFIYKLVYLHVIACVSCARVRVRAEYNIDEGVVVASFCIGCCYRFLINEASVFSTRNRISFHSLSLSPWLTKENARVVERD